MQLNAPVVKRALNRPWFVGELFVNDMRDPQHEEHEQLREWYGGPFAAEDVGQDVTQRRVAAIAKRRRVVALG